ncbi:uncharacterized protein LOC118477483 [Aplysia californica]|uniref:Uncharacterized protein LOC118477483 n=1 Tax=Aplysia californica TaxID=6500 RepID=A0ABM1VR79_APLCA|nr:uncharacterized protein LOC118477483 [Aplysia californica]
MKETADRYMDEAEQLRAASRLLHERREGGSPERSMSRISAPSRLLYVSERQGTQDSIRVRHRRRRMVISDDDSRCVSSLSVPSLPAISPAGRLPSPSARTSRSLPATPSPNPGSALAQPKDTEEDRKKMHEETRAILQTMNVRESQAERERERQQERLERIRRQKRFLAEDRTQQALRLLEKALEMDQALAQDKQRQGMQLRSKLDEMKRKRTQKQEAEFVEVIELKEK